MDKVILKQKTKRHIKKEVFAKGVKYGVKLITRASEKNIENAEHKLKNGGFHDYRNSTDDYVFFKNINTKPYHGAENSHPQSPFTHPRRDLGDLEKHLLGNNAWSNNNDYHLDDSSSSEEEH